MFELFMYVYSCNALSAGFFAVDRALNSYFMIMIHSRTSTHVKQDNCMASDESNSAIAERPRCRVWL